MSDDYRVVLKPVFLWALGVRLGYWQAPVVYSWDLLPVVALRVDIVGKK